MFPASWPDRAAWFEKQLSAHFDSIESSETPHSRLIAAVAYSTLSGGKRLRPLLVLECCRVAGGSDAAALPAAVAVEFVHAFSLVHDDLPAMDDDDLRRGRPTTHRAFSEAEAILAGDWLAVRAFQVLAAAPLSPERRCEMASALAQAACGMIEGQAADVGGETKPLSAGLAEFIHARKTARLMSAACRLGGLAARAATTVCDALAAYGARLGLAFQIVDDILDATSSAVALGKRAGKDGDRNKQTFPAVFGLEQSRRRAAEESAAAVAALASFGPAADDLRLLAARLLDRTR